MNRRHTVAGLLGAAALAAAPVLCLRATGAPPAQSPAPPANTSQSTTTASKSAPAKPATSKKKTTRRRRARGQQAPTADRIKEIQQALAREGHYEGTPTGKWDAGTVSALRSFQQAAGLSVSGKLDARTLQKLGLGSEVAGAAPPRVTPANGNDPPVRP